MTLQKIILVTVISTMSSLCLANKTVIKMFRTKDHTMLGTVTATETTRGLKLTPNLHSLPPGKHGFHVHVMPNCGDHGQAAQGHLDPFHTNKHLGPYNPQGHLGDLPVLVVNNQGLANHAVIAPRLHLKDIKGHSLMIHEGGDNYSDSPLPLGGGGARIACGVISQ